MEKYGKYCFNKMIELKLFVMELNVPPDSRTQNHPCSISAKTV